MIDAKPALPPQINTPIKSGSLPEAATNNDSAPAEKPWGKLTSINHLMIQNSNLILDIVTIGRNSANTIAIPDNRLSGLHCKIIRNSETNAVEIEDLASNGTWLNEDKIGKSNKKELKNGDTIYLLHKTKVKEHETMGYVFTFLNLEENLKKRKMEEDLAKQNAAEEEKKQKEEQQQRDDDLGEEMQCSICIDYIYQCVTLIPCLHNFCASCYSDWMQKSKECPQCRESVMEARKNAGVNSIIDKYLATHPHKKRAKEEYEKMDKKNKFTGEKIQITVPEAPKPEPKPEPKTEEQPLLQARGLLHQLNNNNYFGEPARQNLFQPAPPVGLHRYFPNYQNARNPYNLLGGGMPGMYGGLHGHMPGGMPLGGGGGLGGLGGGGGVGLGGHGGGGGLGLGGLGGGRGVGLGGQGGGGGVNLGGMTNRHNIHPIQGFNHAMPAMPGMPLIYPGALNRRATPRDIPGANLSKEDLDVFNKNWSDEEKPAKKIVDDNKFNDDESLGSSSDRSSDSSRSDRSDYFR